MRLDLFRGCIRSAVLEPLARRLLQIVIFAQREFDSILREHKNFADRVSLYLTLQPFSYAETKAMVKYRLREAAEGVVPAIFTTSGYTAMHLSTGGYPRRIVELGYRVLLALILKNNKRAGWRVVRSCARTGIPTARTPLRVRPALVSLLLICSVAALLFGVLEKTPVLTHFLNAPEMQQASVYPIPGPASTSTVRSPMEKVPPAKKDPPPTIQSLAGDAAAVSIISEDPVIALAQIPSKTAPDIPREQAPSVAPIHEVPKKTVLATVVQSPSAALTNMWGGRYPGYSQIIFSFNTPVAMEGPEINVKEAVLRFAHASSQVAPFRQYHSFPGWVALKQDQDFLLARIGLPENLDGIEHFILQHPDRVIVNLYHDMRPLKEE